MQFFMTPLAISASATLSANVLCKMLWYFNSAWYNMHSVITHCLLQVNIRAHMLTSLLVWFLGSVLYRVNLAHVV